jgi:hypothetical protein
MLIANVATRDGCGGVVRGTVDQRIIRVAEVRLLLPKNYLFEFTDRNRRSWSLISNRRLHTHTERTHVGRL